jgi:hypothetical protein
MNRHVSDLVWFVCSYHFKRSEVVHYLGPPNSHQVRSNNINAGSIYLSSALATLRELVATAEQSHFPECDLLEEVKAAVAEAERCGNVATQLVTKKHRTR